MQILLLTLVAVIVSGCASVALPESPAPTTRGDRAATVSALAVERQWLGQWFRGTPVQIAQRNDGAVTLDVPLEFCFEPGRSRVKPALAAVLDKVAESLTRVPRAQVALLAAPADATAGTAGLALQRAVQIQDHLRSRGVRAERLGKPAVASAAVVQLRLEAPPALTPAAGAEADPPAPGSRA